MARDAETAHFDPARSARAFDRLIEPGDEMPPMIDVEALGVTAGLLAAFLTEFDRLRPNSGVGIYTSQHFWKMLIGPGHYEFAHRPLWVAMYGVGGLQDPPLLPDIWNSYVNYQFRFKKGYLPGYADDLDINFWSGETPMPSTDDQLKGLLAEATTINATSGKMMTDLKKMLAPPPPPPPVNHTMADKTNQAVINLFSGLFGTLTKLEGTLTAAQKGILYGKRQALYAGPAVEEMSLTAAEKAQVIAAL